MSRLEDSSAFAALAAELHAERDVTETGRVIVARLVDLLPDADSAALTVPAPGGTHRLLAASDDLATAAEALQAAEQQGPTWDIATRRDTWIRSADLAADDRWPGWSGPARELGVASLLTVELRTSGRRRGALTLYGTAPGRFHERTTVDATLVYAVHAATALDAAQVVTGLETAMSSRHTIGLAQGILMERFDIDEERSFALLRRLSSSHEMKLREVAAHVVSTGSLPSDGDGIVDGFRLDGGEPAGEQPVPDGV
ncbi:GAF and ANTAR domain-containing protein [Nocardioides zeae]|uniref:GAF and ANTAR domain-containing protein n=1 Tax=Nocardioides imazamoxiresistens TaxID=3231893 RepID=A0ABU3PQF1_9ACTN|nr:GAF and ANTAR domain-containing protein [Nocardioides zeae]MDT9591444.1 GAF and ANTAR domain-containing protein [Nocardioides zeae]